MYNGGGMTERGAISGIAATDEVPLYLRIAGELRENIRSGVYKAGERIPTEEALSRRFGAE